jgi:hypothetical protein
VSADEDGRSFTPVAARRTAGAPSSALVRVPDEIVSLATCGLAVPIFLAFHIVAAVRALEGQDYEHPFIGDVVRKIAL